MQRIPIKQRVAKVVPFLQCVNLLADPPSCDTAPYELGFSRRPATGSKLPATFWITRTSFKADDRLPYDQQTLEKRLIKPDEAGQLLKNFEPSLRKLSLSLPSGSNNSCTRLSGARH